MRLGRVRGSIWGARHGSGLDGAKLLLVEPMEVRPGEARPVPTGGEVVAVDALGAGPGEWVLYAHGSRVRDLTVGAAVCDKDVVVAIVDDVEIEAAGR